MEKDALLIIDIQNDFCPGGSLAVPGGDKIIPLINSISDRFDTVVATQDWHPAGHLSFASNHKEKNPGDKINLHGIKQTLWPDHCVEGRPGAEFHPDLNLKPVSLILRKGSDPQTDSYSAFRENDKKTVTGLGGYLQSRGIKKIYICGLATDYCVLFSALDSIKEGFKTFFIEDASKGIDSPPGSIKKAVQKMDKKGIETISVNQLQL